MAEQEGWRAGIQAFFRKAGEPAPKKMFCQGKAKDRLAALYWMRAIQNALVSSTSAGLERFGPTAWQEHILGGAAPPTLVLCMDQHQVQWCGFYYLTLGPPQLCAVAVMDHNHRRSNDVWAAIKSAGRTSDVVQTLL